MKAGAVVWKYRAGWCLARLHREGSVRNVGGGQWETTEAGRNRLEREKDAWSTDNFGSGRATVRTDSSAETSTDEESDSGGPAWNPERWTRLCSQLPDTSMLQAHSRHKDKRSLDHYTLATPDMQALVIAMNPKGESES